MTKEERDDVLEQLGEDEADQAWSPLVVWSQAAGGFLMADALIRFCPWCGQHLPVASRLAGGESAYKDPSGDADETLDVGAYADSLKSFGTTESLDFDSLINELRAAQKDQ